MGGQSDKHEGRRLVHTGLVCREIESAKACLQQTLNVQWVAVEREDWSLMVFGKPVSIPLRICFLLVPIARAAYLRKRS